MVRRYLPRRAGDPPNASHRRSAPRVRLTHVAGGLGTVIALTIAIAAGVSCKGDATGARPTAATLQVDQIAVSERYACAATSTGVYCWGENQFGRFGNGDTISVKLATVPTPGAVGVVRPSTLSLGLWHACAGSADGVLQCWGRNHNGQLGDGTTEDQLRPTRVNGRNALVTVVTGDDFSCGLEASGLAWCWGGNSRGQLGIGTRGPQQCRFGNYCEPLPTPVQGGRQYKSMAAGSNFACAIAVDGAAFCWGDALNGELGAVPDTRDCDDGGCSSQPLAVRGGLRFQTITAGGLYACGATTSGQLYCWGALHNGIHGNCHR